MQKKKNMKSGNKEIAVDILVVLLCLIGILFGLYHFNKAINQSFDNINETPIGTITFKENSAQRKLLDRVAWDRLKQDSFVYNGDLIRTGELSEAIITFTDGNVMNLYDQTLAQVFLDADGAAVDFSGGGISLDTTTSTGGITLRSGDSTVQLESGSSLNAAVATGQSGEVLESASLSVQVTDGVASMVASDKDGDDDVISLTEGSTLVLSSDGEVLAPPPITVLSPTMNERFLKQMGETRLVIFRLTDEEIEQDDYITLETSMTSDFSVLTEQITFTDIREISLDMPVGMWYWRMYLESERDKIVSSKLQVLDAPIPELIVPANDYEYTYRSKIPSVRFMWTNDNYASEWQLEVADNAQMTNPIINQNATQSSNIISSLEEGTWYWRVTPSYSTRINTQLASDQVSSLVNSFSIVQQGELDPVKLMLPAEGGFVDAAKVAQGVHFSWQNDYEADHYNVTISDDPNLSSPLIAQEVTENYFVLTSEIATMEKGQWYWAVTKTDSEGNQSPQSEIRSFSTADEEVVLETIFPPDGYVLAESLIPDARFTWKTNLPIAMRFQVASDTDFANVTIDTTLTSSSTDGIDLPLGTWYWRIVADTEEDGEKTLEYYTQPKSVISAPNLDTVTMLTPTANGKVDTNSYSPPIEYTWEEVADAQYYQMKLYHDSDINTPVYEDLNLQDTNVLIDMENMTEGTYTWTMLAVALETPSSTRRNSVISEQTFILGKLEPIELLSPTSGTRITGLSAILNPPQVQWSSVGVPINAEFILTRRNVGLSVASREEGSRPSSSDIVVSIENPDTTVQLPQLSEGTWYWTVIAETTNNGNITPLEPATIIVNPIPLLSAPRNLAPQEKMVFDIDYLRSQRFADFSWSAVTGAGGYILRIKNVDGETIIEERINRGTSYRLENLAILNQGTFTWTVEAVARQPNGTIIQRGRVMTSTFTIDLPALKKPEIKDTGELYGL